MEHTEKDAMDLKTAIDKAVRKFLGFSESTVVTAALYCLQSGCDKKKTIEKLSQFLEEYQAVKFTDKLFSIFDKYKRRMNERSRKRKPDDDGMAKRSKRDGDDDDDDDKPDGAGDLSKQKIEEMMQEAQQMIRERKAMIEMLKQPITSTESFRVHEAKLMAEAVEKVKKANELQARIQSQLAGVNLTGAVLTTNSSTRPTPVILDAEGRTIDAKTGQAIQLQQHMPTLKANIRAKKREQFKVVQEKPPEEISESKFFDSRLSSKSAQRNRRTFKFHPQGKYLQLAQKLRARAQLERLQCEIALAAKKTGIASAAKLATIRANKTEDNSLPTIEWWDAYVLQSDNYSAMQDRFAMGAEGFEGITNLVEHPVQMKPPEQEKEVQLAVILTKKERKKLRRQTRAEGQKELQEKIRLGLLPPPEPKVRMANLMRVLGTEAVQDPTKVEAHVRAQMAKRQRVHEQANAARKLTKEQRRDKKIRKIKEDTENGVHVSVYRVRDLTNPAKKFKLEANVNQLLMTGIVVLHKECNIVVVEGGPKQQNKFRKLILNRMKWDGEQQKIKDEDDEDEEVVEKKTNACQLVWEGTVKDRAFGEIKFKMCPTEAFAREQFKKRGVEHYWDVAYNSAIFESTTDDAN